MTYTKHSTYSIDEVEQRLRTAAQAHKFGVLNVFDIEQTLRSKGIELGKACRVIDVCNPQAASQALGHDMRASVVLPCRISIYSDGNGSTLATVNPTDIMRATGLAGVEQLAGEIEREIVAIINEAA